MTKLRILLSHPDYRQEPFLVYGASHAPAERLEAAARRYVERSEAFIA